MERLSLSPQVKCVAMMDERFMLGLKNESGMGHSVDLKSFSISKVMGGDKIDSGAYSVWTVVHHPSQSLLTTSSPSCPAMGICEKVFCCYPWNFKKGRSSTQWYYQYANDLCLFITYLWLLSHFVDCSIHLHSSLAFSLVTHMTSPMKNDFRPILCSVLLLISWSHLLIKNATLAQGRLLKSIL